MNIVNIAAYKFVDLVDLEALRHTLQSLTHSLEMRGTILLSPEGINFSVAGLPEAIQSFRTFLAQRPEFTDLDYKESWSEEKPFNRMLVKIKKEIIAFGLTEIRPVKQRAPHISPQELKTWLDEGEDIILLDARNTYEVRLGKFKNAIDFSIEHFRDFPRALKQHGETIKNKKIVTYCTGGIRCEKSGLLMQQQGFDVYQLDGGILNYFKTCGGAHYEGECFIYDRRVGLDPNLQETGTVQCFACLSPVSIEEQRLPTYVPDLSCPSCSRTSA